MKTQIILLLKYYKRFLSHRQNFIVAKRLWQELDETNAGIIFDMGLLIFETLLTHSKFGDEKLYSFFFQRETGVKAE